MGLGKSLQTICIIASKHQERRATIPAGGQKLAPAIPSLIVCPPTLIGHWYHEILKFADNIKPFKYFGSSKDREGLRRQFGKYDVIITSYEIVRADVEALRRIPFLYCVLDEGHIIKNGKSKLSMAIKALQSNHRLILSGTPIQNNVLELWSLFDFLMPGFLGSEKLFNEKFSKPILANRDGKATARQSEAGEFRQGVPSHNC
jgi:TATA-binding protein-associated factor